MYANPVTLTYNQQRKFTTVFGAVCTIISLLLLIYLAGVAITEQLIDPKFVHTGGAEVLPLSEPSAFQISPTLMMVMTNLTYGPSFTLQEGETLDSYVGGVYVQVSHNAGKAKESSKNDKPEMTYSYSLPVDCVETYKDYVPKN